MKAKIEASSAEGRRKIAFAAKVQWLENQQWNEERALGEGDAPVPRHATPTTAARSRVNSTAALKQDRERNQPRLVARREADLYRLVGV